MRQISNQKAEVLIVDDFHPALMEGLNSIGITYDYCPELQEEEILQRINSYSGFIVRSKLRCGKTFFEKASSLKWIARGGSGMDNIDETEAAQAQVALIHAPEGNRIAVAEHTLGLMLTLANRIVMAHSQVQQKKWNREANRGVELEGSTLAIIGVGNAGSNVARKASGIGMRVIGYDKYTQPEYPYVKMVDMPTIFEEADWLSLHVPLTQETKGMVNTSFLQQFQKSIGLLNLSRGPVVNTKEVLSALYAGKLFAFGADVLENEKPTAWTPSQKAVYQKLLQQRNVVITPHVAGWTVESYRKISEVLYSKIAAFYCRN
jgi:D-3-phosphoglycerate dehydrogenase